MYRLVARQNLELALIFCGVQQAYEMVWPWLWEVALDLPHKWRIRKSIAKTMAVFATCVGIGQVRAAALVARA